MKKLIFISLIVCFENVSALPRMNAPKKENCNTRVPSGQHYTDLVEKAVGNGEKIEAEKIAVRGEDDRVIRESRSTLAIWCKTKSGKGKFGSLNLVGAKDVAYTVSHIFTETKSCKKIFEISNCWVEDPVNKKKSKLGALPDLGDKCLDRVVKLQLSKPVENGIPYKMASGGEVAEKEILVIGAASDTLNLKNGMTLQGPGEIVRSGDKNGYRMFSHTGDTGSGTSGGGVVLRDNPNVIIGVHAGDWKKTKDGTPLDCDQLTNCGGGFYLP